MKLRPYQAAAADAAWRAGRGLVIAPTGAGKTEVGLELARRVGGPVVVLVHTRDLVGQWVQRARSVGLHGAELEHGPLGRGVHVGTVQGLQAVARWRGTTPGAVLVDEVHHAAAPTWRHALRVLRCKRTWGFTATLEREDGRVHEVVRAVGPVVARISPSTVERVGAVRVPMVRVMRTGWRPWTGDVADDRMRSPARNRRIVELVRTLEGQGRHVLVVVDRVEHARLLARRVAGAAHLVGPDAPAERARVLGDAKAGRVRVIFATSLVDEGLDVPRLDTIVLAGPSAVTARTQQRVGRILRPAPGKGVCLVIDLVDADTASTSAFARRVSLYASRGWPVQEVR